MILSFKDYNASKKLTVLSVIEDREYFLWQQEVQCFHMKENFNNLKLEVVILHETEEPSIWAKRLSEKFNVSTYKVTNESSENYRGQFKPLGVYLRTNDSLKQPLENVLAIDSDVILNKHIDYNSLLESNSWKMSDCSSYLNYDYLKKNLTDEQITKLGDIVGISLDEIKSMDTVGGAQYLYTSVSENKDIFKKMSDDSVKLYSLLDEFAKNGSKIQKWTAEMWAQSWNIHKLHDYVIEKESMSFAWASTPISEKNKYAFTHFAGSPSNEGTFKKTKHSGNIFKEDLKYVTYKENCAYHWYTLIERYKNKSVGFNL
jgi:hypothetical protein